MVWPKHGFRDINYPGILEINVRKVPQQDALKISVKDNGSGWPQSTSPTKHPKHKSLGLAIVQDRIDLLQKDKKIAIASFEIIDWKTIDPLKTGLQVDFIIPIKFKIHD